MLAGSALATAAAAEPPTTAPRLVPAPPDTYWSASLSGGPGKDGIPSIDEPRFVSADEADGWLDGEDRVIGVYLDGEARAYPQPLLVYHEIVNDTVGGENVSVTYCPLTGTGIGFLRGDTELGVSGRLVNSNLIMYDRATDSHWPQILGAAVEGPLEGRGLEEFRVFWTTWERWRERHSETRVLSRRTGHVRNYRRDPYGDYTPLSGYYAEGSSTMFPLLNESDRFPAKREVFGFRTREEAVAVDMAALRKTSHLVHKGKDGDYLALYDPGLDTAWIYRADAGSVPDNLDDVAFTPAGPSGEALQGLEPVNGFEAMWFAWYAFYPDTIVLDGSA